MSDKKTTFQWDDSNGVYTVEVWCDGRDYDPSTESYHPKYSYKIVTPDWEYIDNDIRGGANELPNPIFGAKSLLAFLYACQEGFQNARLFPPHVREWAYGQSEQLSLLYDELEDKGKRLKGS